MLVLIDVKENRLRNRSSVDEFYETGSAWFSLLLHTT